MFLEAEKKHNTISTDFDKNACNRIKTSSPISKKEVNFRNERSTTKGHNNI